MKSALGNYFNSPENQQQQPGESADPAAVDGVTILSKAALEERQGEGLDEDTAEAEMKFKKSPVHESYQPTQPLIASFILNQVIFTDF